jgi:hypothetical protein
MLQTKKGTVGNHLLKRVFNGPLFDEKKEHTLTF